MKYHIVRISKSWAAEMSRELTAAVAKIETEAGVRLRLAGQCNATGEVFYTFEETDTLVVPR